MEWVVRCEGLGGCGRGCIAEMEAVMIDTFMYI